MLSDFEVGDIVIGNYSSRGEGEIVHINNYITVKHINPKNQQFDFSSLHNGLGDGNTIDCDNKGWHYNSSDLTLVRKKKIVSWKNRVERHE